MRGASPSALKALAIAARSFGITVSPDQVIRDQQITAAELSPAELMRCAGAVGLRARGLRTRWAELGTVGKALPAIVILRDGSAMVLVGTDFGPNGERVHLLDPALNGEAPMTLGRDQFMSVWGGSLILLQRDISLADEEQPFSIRLLAALIMRDGRIVRDIALAALMLSMLALAPIMFWRLMTGSALQYHAMGTFTVLVVVMAILVAFETAFGMLRRYLLLRMTTRVDVKITTDMFARVLNLPVDYFERTPAGMTLHKMHQIGRVRQFLIGQLFGTVLDSGVLLFFLPVMFAFSPSLTAIVVAVGALICLWIVAMLPAYRRKSGAVEGAEAARGVHLSQTIQGIRTVKSLALESRQLSEWDGLTARVAQLRFEEGNLGNLIQGVVTPLERLMVSGSLAVGVYVAITSNDPVYAGTLFAFVMLSQRVAAPLMQMSQLIQQYDEARTAIGMVGSLVNQAPEEGRSGHGVRTELQGHVEFAKVRFQYRGALRPALNDISFEIPLGTTLGVMGRSGSGKTTITRLIQRLHSDYLGLIKIDGVDVRQYDLTHLRSSLGVVLQENFLFSGTIRQNITIAKPDASFEDMVHAARLAGAEEFIDKLPGGYETYIYEGSPNLSGGQRQRLAIARALITNPRILILDEATSALDAESEAIVNANIDRIAQGRTVITISHRLSSLVKADAIMVMDQGAVNDIGKHHELLERNEIYANLWYTQNEHAGPPPAQARPQLAYRGPQSVA